MSYSRQHNSFLAAGIQLCYTEAGLPMMRKGITHGMHGKASKKDPV